jgi:hypothetical protein
VCCAEQGSSSVTHSMFLLVVRRIMDVPVSGR